MILMAADFGLVIILQCSDTFPLLRTRGGISHTDDVNENPPSGVDDRCGLTNILTYYVYNGQIINYTGILK